MALLLVVAIAVLGHAVGHHIRAIESWIGSLGPWGVLAFMVLLVLATTLLVPETALAIMAGALFGLGEGLAVVVAGGIVAAALQFFLARTILHTHVQRALGSRPRLASIQQAVTRSEVRLQALLRLTPLNPATLSYIFGAAGVRFAGFLLACCAMLPNELIEVYFGYAGRHVAKIAGSNTAGLGLHDVTVVGGLVTGVVVMVLVSRIAREAVARSVAETSASRSADDAR